MLRTLKLYEEYPDDIPEWQDSKTVGKTVAESVGKYEAPWPVYSMSWSVRRDTPYRFALGSFLEGNDNKVQIVSFDEHSCSVKSVFSNPYPTSKLMWIPDKGGVYPDLLATGGDFLRLWRANQCGSPRLECFLGTTHPAPLTSIDWNEVDPNLMATSSVDGTCTIWGLETGRQLRRINITVGSGITKVMTHDDPVCDIAFSRAGSGQDRFGSVGADGSLRLFDLRFMDLGLIYYEDPTEAPLLRMAYNKHDPNYLATVAGNSCEVVIVDVRVPRKPAARLRNHRACVNGFAWAPHNSSHICTVGDDHQALMWDIKDPYAPIEDPTLVYAVSEGEINQIQWSATTPEWIAICYNSTCEILRI